MSNESVEIGRLWLQLKRIADAMVPQEREPFINLPGLRGYWPMSTVDFLGNAKDHSAGSSDLSRSGSPTFGYDGDPFVQCGVASDFLQGSTSAQDVTGVEAWMAPSIRGLTVGCWVKVDATPANVGGMVSIYGAASQRSFALFWNSSNEALFGVSGAGTVVVNVASPASAVGVWAFVVGRFTPSTEVAVFVNDVKTVVTASVPASAFNSTQAFEVGRIEANNARILEAKFRDAFICAAILSDAQIASLRLSSLPT